MNGSPIGSRFVYVPPPHPTIPVIRRFFGSPRLRELSGFVEISFIAGATSEFFSVFVAASVFITFFVAEKAGKGEIGCGRGRGKALSPPDWNVF